MKKCINAINHCFGTLQEKSKIPFIHLYLSLFLVIKGIFHLVVLEQQSHKYLCMQEKPLVSTKKHMSIFDLLIFSETTMTFSF